MSSGIATQDHVRHCLRGPTTLHKHLGRGFQPCLQQRRRRQGSGQAESPESAAAAASKGSAPITPDNWTTHIGGYSHPGQ